MTDAVDTATEAYIAALKAEIAAADAVPETAALIAKLEAAKTEVVSLMGQIARAQGASVAKARVTLQAFTQFTNGQLRAMQHQAVRTAAPAAAAPAAPAAAGATGAN